ncbi:FMN-binding protein [Schaalia suimastitidis]|uniref:FMN-binding protein n=1 Tax=Schaalia suimastitidis TaxID=121163 RepID=UPI0004013FEE|nr:FMN-binding protein [Schaalia suimastitidis]
MTTPRPTVRAIAATTAVLGGIGAVIALSPIGQNIAAAEQQTSSTQTTSTTDAETTTSTQTTTSSADDTTTASTATTDTSTTTQSATEATASSSDGTWEGSVYQTPYGPMQVSATISGGTITAIDWLQLPSDNHSQRINNTAAPRLVESALAAQSADVDSVSGASYTSAAFKSSLQAALAQAGL